MPPLDKHISPSTGVDFLDAITGVLGKTPEPAPEGRRASAVLIPLMEIDGHWHVVLTKRASHLRHHAGQISFPGGAIEPGETVAEAALREAHEEIDLHPDHVTVKGHLPSVLTTANYHIAPVLGVVNSTPVLTPQPEEVDHILLEKLHPLLLRRHHRQEPRQYNGLDYKTWVIDHDKEYIWGATAKVIVQWSALMSDDWVAPKDDDNLGAA
jgi:8-oxo-dGTP pyrophosphatase MutT (NUDIX family)